MMTYAFSIWFLVTGQSNEKYIDLYRVRDMFSRILNLRIPIFFSSKFAVCFHFMDLILGTKLTRKNPIYKLILTIVYHQFQGNAMFVYNLYNGWLLDVSNLAIASHIFNPYCCISIRYHSYIMSAHFQAFQRIPFRTSNIEMSIIMSNVCQKIVDVQFVH